MDSTQVLVTVAGSAGMAAVLGAIVTGIFSKRKLGAEATEIITKAAAGVVTSLQDENRRLSDRAHAVVGESEAKMTKMASDHSEFITRMEESHQEELDEVRRVLQLHVAWDAIALAKLGELGVELPPTPPLLPARRFDHPTL